LLNLAYFSVSGKITEEESINKLIKYSDLSYLLKKLRIQIILLSLIDYPLKKYEYSTFKLVEPLLTYPLYASNNRIRLSLINISLLKEKNIESFKKLLNLIDEYEDSLSKNDLEELYRQALNFCTYELRKGNHTFYEKAYLIHRKMHQKDLFVLDETIPTIVLVNIIITACRVDKYNWALEINNVYSKYIDKAIRKSVFNYNMGVINFFKKEFDMAHASFLGIGKTNTFLDLNSRVYILKCLYERNYEYSYYLVQNIRSLKEFLKNQKKINKIRKRAYLSFTKILLQLYHLKFGRGKLNISDIETQLNQQDLINNKAWLLEKIKDLKAAN